MKIAVQLYSIRDCIKDGDDMLKMLGKVKELGFDGVEFAGYFGLDAATLKARLDELGLVAVGTHAGLDDYESDKLADTIEFGKTLGMKYMGIGGAKHSTPEDCEHIASVLGGATKAAEKDGIVMYYHNHSDEFKPFPDGRLPIDIIRAGTKLQIDTYWSFHAGVDNYKYLTEHKDEIVFIHIKDGVDGKPMALGEGNCDLKAVVNGAKDAGIEWIILENDDPKPDGISDIARSMKWLRANV